MKWHVNMDQVGPAQVIKQAFKSTRTQTSQAAAGSYWREKVGSKSKEKTLKDRPLLWLSGDTSSHFRGTEHLMVCRLILSSMSTNYTILQFLTKDQIRLEPCVGTAAWIIQQNVIDLQNKPFKKQFCFISYSIEYRFHIKHADFTVWAWLWSSFCYFS